MTLFNDVKGESQLRLTRIEEGFLFQIITGGANDDGEIDSRSCILTCSAASELRDRLELCPHCGAQQCLHPIVFKEDSVSPIHCTTPPADTIERLLNAYDAEQYDSDEWFAARYRIIKAFAQREPNAPADTRAAFMEAVKRHYGRHQP